jgi:hypothetical protein
VLGRLLAIVIPPTPLLRGEPPIYAPQKETRGCPARCGIWLSKGRSMTANDMASVRGGRLAFDAELSLEGSREERQLR